ncbi:hypothetical protein IMZ68_05395 [Candidatus Bathyarchaeota archaeon]|nr:hypothetical protein [Candidatus Bathyarchaeota archaeon]
MLNSGQEQNVKQVFSYWANNRSSYWDSNGKLFAPSNPELCNREETLPLYDEIYAIKDRILVNITDPNFPSTGKRECIWFELREENSSD